MMYGLDPDTLRNIKAVIAKTPKIEKVILYGSRAKGNYRNGSDIDITLLGQGLNLNNSVYPLMDELEELSLPYIFDISIFSQIDNDDLIKHILGVGKTFYLMESGKLKIESGESNNFQFSTLNFPLPKGWEVKRLGEVYDVRDGTHDSPKYHDSGYPLITSKNLKHDEIVYDKVKYISEIDYKNINKRSGVDIGDVLFAMIGTIGNPVVVIKQPDYAIKNVALFKVSPTQCSWFLKYFLGSKLAVSKMQKEAKGTTQKFVGLGYLRSFQIPLPPLPEQKRIVTILDKAFNLIENGKLKIEKNLKNAKELFQSYLNKIFTEKGEGWEVKRLGDVCKIIGGYSFKSGDFLKQGKYQVIRMGNVRPGIIRENERPVFIDELEENILKRALLLPNDVIITQTGTKKKRDYGFTVVIEKDNYLLNQRISAIRFSENYFPKFFLYFSWTNLFKDQYFANETGTVGQGNVGIGAITNANVPFSSIKIQQNIIETIDALSVETNKLEAIYQQEIKALTELKQSILKKAFEGEL